MQKALGQDENLERDEVLNLIFWYRVLGGISLGATAGVLGISGWPVISAFIFIIFPGVIFYQFFLQVEYDDFGQQEILMEGLPNSIGFFFLLWIVISTYKS